MLSGEVEITNGVSKAISLFLSSINNTKLLEFNNLFKDIVCDKEIDIANWKEEEYYQFFRGIDLVDNCKDATKTNSALTNKSIPDIILSFIYSLHDIQNNNNDVKNQISDIIINFLYDSTNGDVKNIINYIIPLNIQNLIKYPIKSEIIILLISSLKSHLNGDDKGILIFLLIDIIKNIYHFLIITIYKY